MTPSLEKLVKANGQMKAVVAGLQQYVWLNETTTAYTQVDLNALIQELIPELKLEFDQVQLSIDHNQLPTIEGDQEQLK
jgi:light-regulated signal transduction histidine kinase (bacteriophytochrome)